MPQCFKQEIYFKQLTGFIFYIPQQKGTFLSVSVITHTFTTQNTELLHILCTSDNYYLPLAALQPDSVLFTTVLVSHHKNKWLCYKNVIKYEVRSAIVSDFTAWNGNSYHQCAAWPLNIRPEGCPQTSAANWQYIVCNIIEDWRSQCKICMQNFSL